MKYQRRLKVPMHFTKFFLIGQAPEETSDSEVVNRNDKAPFQISITKYSKYWKLHRVTAWANRFIKNVDEKEKKTDGPLTAKGIQEFKNSEFNG